MRHWTRFGMVLATMFLMVAAGCARLPGTGAPATTIAAAQVPTMTLQLGDMPTGFQLVGDSTPTNAQLAQQLSMPASATMLDHLGRHAGTYRTFTYTMAEPSTINGPTQAIVEVDLFGTPAQAQTWLAARQTAVVASVGPPVAVGVPGQRHFVCVTMQRGEAIVMTKSVLAFTERNVYVEIATVLLGPGPSLAENERYADLIDTRILQG